VCCNREACKAQNLNMLHVMSSDVEWNVYICKCIFDCCYIDYKDKYCIYIHIFMIFWRLDTKKQTQANYASYPYKSVQKKACNQIISRTQFRANQARYPCKFVQKRKTCNQIISTRQIQANQPSHPCKFV